MNDATKLKKSGAVATSNPFTEHGADSVEYEFLKFVKGDYFAGKEKRPVEVGTRLVANLFSYEIGHVNFPPGGGKPIKCMGRVIDGFKADRNLVPENDAAYWEIDDKGKPIDPFKEAAEILLADPVTKAVYRFSTTSRGGPKALKKLSLAFGNEMENHPDEWPIIALEVDGWESKKIGWVAKPSFPIVGWIGRDAVGALTPLPAPAPKPAPAPALAAPAKGEPPAPEHGDPGPSPDDSYVPFDDDDPPF
jgi:hypothetical protein